MRESDLSRMRVVGVLMIPRELYPASPLSRKTGKVGVFAVPAVVVEQVFVGPQPDGIKAGFDRMAARKPSHIELASDGSHVTGQRRACAEGILGWLKIQS